MHSKTKTLGLIWSAGCNLFSLAALGLVVWFAGDYVVAYLDRTSMLGFPSLGFNFKAY